eukprot:CAMPEP_0178624148 /NCGR_PEP_ID=MMETSP0698-20121128/7203_1 /TAXON_ID=265572 /ORGANISM="Extubocellulus spinifer, Strain CCMP396" /LENGTH=192 /DNA_ID=CAMNT_0020263251 /DNA_START=269 /DNA_END=843 /DNA_ORIENTATION=+
MPYSAARQMVASPIEINGKTAPEQEMNGAKNQETESNLFSIPAGISSPTGYLSSRDASALDAELCTISSFETASSGGVVTLPESFVDDADGADVNKASCFFAATCTASAEAVSQPLPPPPSIMAPADQPHTSATVQSPPPPGIPALISAFTVLLQLHSVELTVARSGIRMQTHVLASCRSSKISRLFPTPMT